jgi:hypothetical protein
VLRAQAPLALCFFPSTISCKWAAAASISPCLYWPARLSAEITQQRCTLVKSPNSRSLRICASESFHSPARRTVDPRSRRPCRPARPCPDSQFLCERASLSIQFLVHGAPHKKTALQSPHNQRGTTGTAGRSMIFAAKKRSHARLARWLFVGAPIQGGLPNNGDDDAPRANRPGINSA